MTVHFEIEVRYGPQGNWQALSHEWAPFTFEKYEHAESHINGLMGADYRIVKVQRVK